MLIEVRLLVPVSNRPGATKKRHSLRSARANWRVSHSFSPDFYLKGFVQYNDDRNTASFNFLWWYHYKPGSDLYVVYNQGWDLDLPLTSRDALLNSYRVRSRSLQVKLTYWLAR